MKFVSIAITLVLFCSAAAADNYSEAAKLLVTTNPYNVMGQIEVLAAFQNLLPSKHHVWRLDTEPVGPVKAWTDEIILAILSTQNGKEICEQLWNVDELRTQLGLSAEGAQKALFVCGNFLSRSYFQKSGSKAGGLRDVRFARSWTYVINESGKPGPVASWTSVTNHSMIVLDKDQINPTQVAMRIAHEMAISFDSKYADATTLLVHNANGEKVDPCQLISTLANPRLRLAAVTARAFNWESGVMKELSDKKGWPLAPEHRRVLSGTWTCAQELETFGKYSEVFLEMMPEWELSLLKETGSKACDSKPRSDIDLTTLNINENGLLLSVPCYLAHARLSRWNSGISAGPRPNLTGGIGDGE